MMAFEWWFAALAIIAALFIAWPLVAGRRRTPAGEASGPSEVEERIAFNDAVYADQLQELDQQLASGDVTEEQHRKLKVELDKRHQQDNSLDASSPAGPRFRQGPWLLGGLAVLLPLLAFVLYANWGAADDWQIEKLNQQLVSEQQRGADPEALRDTSQKLFDKLESRLEEEPENLNNRFLLARTAVELGDYRRALEAYRYILERQPNSPQVVGEMAQVLFIAAGNRFTPEVQQVFDRALQMDPENTDLLGFAGIGAFQSGKFRLAIDYWEKGLNLLKPGDNRYQTWQRAIAEARKQLSPEEAADLAQDESAGAKAAAAGPVLEVSVSLGDEVKANPNDTVFIYARAWQGAKMPLAMQQVKVADLPLTVKLDESMGMIQGMTMSRFPELEVVARISSAGVANARSGDWQATAGPLDSSLSDQSVKLTIDSQIP